LAEWLAAIDEALNPVAEPLERSVEGACTTFVVLVRDGDPDAMLAGIAPNPPAAVAFVPHVAVRAALGMAWSTALDGPALEELFEGHRLVPLSRGEHEGH